MLRECRNELSFCPHVVDGSPYAELFISTWVVLHANSTEAQEAHNIYLSCYVGPAGNQEKEIIFDWRKVLDVLGKENSPKLHSKWEGFFKPEICFHSGAPKAEVQWTPKPFQLNGAILDGKRIIRERCSAFRCFR